MKVAKGYRVDLYEHSESAGRSLSLTSDAPELASRGFDNLVSSYKVTKVTQQVGFKTLNYLKSISGKSIVAGQHNDQKDGTGVTTYTNKVKDITGKLPGLWSGDFNFHGNDGMRWEVVHEAERQFKAGALVNLMWHVCPPTQDDGCGWEGGIKSHLSDQQWNDLITDGGELNRKWKARMDEVAVYLQYLEDKGVEVMWRPLHEMNQGNFWWGGRTGPNGTRRLYQITRDYMVKVKGLTNLIWEWNVQDLSTNYADYNPGSDYFDVASLDCYGDGYYNMSYYEALRAQAGGKPMGIGESFHVPSASVIENLRDMTFFMIWSYGLQQNNSDQAIKDTYYNPRVITLDELPR
ncbi:mannan endo-1,4-beta-mannosidase [Caldimonas brevitalea]|uniref:Mannan endo-1,4-beta-mannosidase n=1 Tax=Caldimonas brevitalea TaxID=413882 RepID=A0A0G3BIJ4_9BURK|nr:mannan endo-1,4-beta-mannosidase [Caldimonas brevitalea]